MNERERTCGSSLSDPCSLESDLLQNDVTWLCSAFVFNDTPCKPCAPDSHLRLWLLLLLLWLLSVSYTHLTLPTIYSV